MRRELPRGWTVRYDHHRRPAATTAVVLDGFGYVRGVGVAKFNAHDTRYSFERGEQIALGRALKRMADAGEWAAALPSRNHDGMSPTVGAVDWADEHAH